MSRSACRSLGRTSLLSAALAVLLFGFLSCAAPAALGTTTRPGDNGTVNVHAAGTPVDDQRNEPHVCEFYLAAFNFDTLQEVQWSIHQHPPTGTALALSGSLVLRDGSGFTDVMSLPAGHYKLAWTFVGQHGAAKSKVFWSTCAPEAVPTVTCTATAPSPNVPESSGPSEANSPSEPNGSSSPSGSSPGGGNGNGNGNGTGGAGGSGNGGGNVNGGGTCGNAGAQLARTGSNIPPLLVIGGSLPLGGWLLMRRRATRH